MRHDADRQTPDLRERLQGGAALGHLHQGQDALVHARAAGCGEADHRPLRLARQLNVTLTDQVIYDAELVGCSTDHDLAVLRIAAPPLRLQPQ